MQHASAHACSYATCVEHFGSIAANEWFCSAGLLPGLVFANPTPGMRILIDVDDVTEIGPTYLEPWAEDRCLWRWCSVTLGGWGISA